MTAMLCKCSPRNDQAAVVAVVVIQIMMTAPRQQQQQQIEEYLRDEFEDLRRQVVADRELSDA
jgi:hypothetical protein